MHWINFSRLGSQNQRFGSDPYSHFSGYLPPCVTFIYLRFLTSPGINKFLVLFVCNLVLQL